VPYTWLYSTPVHGVAAATVAVITSVLLARGGREDGALGALTCASTGTVLLLAATAALLAG
jgi:hypothetical protein